MSFESSALLLAWVAIVLLAFAMAGLLRQIQAVAVPASRLPGLGPPVGTLVPAILPQAGSWSWPRLLLFVDPDCTSCAALLPHVESLARRPDGPAITILVSGDVATFRSDHSTVLLRCDEDFERFAVTVTPLGVLVGDDGRLVASAPLGSPAALQELIVTRGGGSEQLTAASSG